MIVRMHLLFPMTYTVKQTDKILPPDTGIGLEKELQGALSSVFLELWHLLCVR